MAPRLRCVLEVFTTLARYDLQSIALPDRTNAAARSFDFSRSSSSENDADPAERLLGVIGASYTELLGALLAAEQLPWGALEVKAQVASAADPRAPRLDTVAIHPTILGADLGIRWRYRSAAQRARNRNLVGQAIRGNIAYYRLGEVTIVASRATSATNALDDYIPTRDELDPRNVKAGSALHHFPSRRTHKASVS